MVPVMGLGKTSRGTDKMPHIHHFGDPVETMLVISTTLQAQCCVLNHQRNGYLGFIDRLPLIQ
jgi:hypothetical protein